MTKKDFQQDGYLLITLEKCASTSTRVSQVGFVVERRRHHDHLFPGILDPWIFFWGFVKDQMFLPFLPANVIELGTRIIAAVAYMTREMVCGVWQKINYMSDVCRITSGNNIEP
jgi:hypothetical protein